MLKAIRVKNVALIHEAELLLGEGLNVLTGETGAGKSILIDSIHLALGARADRGLIRQGAQYAYVELEFTVPEYLTQQLEMMGASPEDGVLILSRRLENGKNICRINGEVASNRLLSQAASLLIDIHGQQENTTLLKEKKHLQILDLYCGRKLSAVSEKLAQAYNDYMELLHKLEESEKRDAGREREMDLAAYEVSEIDEAALQEGEDVRLEAEFKRLSNSMQIMESVSRAKDALDGYEGGALALLGSCMGQLKEAQRYDDFGQTTEALLQAEQQMQEAARELSRYLESIDTDPGRLQEISDRLDLINRLKKKYGNSLAQIASYAEQRRQELGELQDYEQFLSSLKAEIKTTRERLEELCSQAHEIREKGGIKLAQELRTALLELGFSHVEFETAIQQDEKYLSAEGNDHVSFLVSLNAGESKRPLTEVASGGEISRIMLAVKAVMADKDRIPTVIFDEVDAGISGQTAWKVSEKMEVIGREHQLICITHLPQIAAMADSHFRIEKTESQKETKTAITKLDKEGMIQEVARLLGSDTITESALVNAAELKEKAQQEKNKNGR